MILLLLSCVSSASALLIGEQTNGDGVSYIVASSTKDCQSGFLETGDGLCVAEPTCIGEYAVTSIDGDTTVAAPGLRADRTAGVGTLAIQVLQPSAAGRIVTSIVLNDTNPLCNYPGANWMHGVDTTGAACLDVYVSDIPWAIASSECGLTRSENASFVVYAGNVTVSYSDDLPAIDGYTPPPRQVASALKFIVEQPTTLDVVSSSVNIFDNPRLLSVITKQKFDVATGNATLGIVLTLSAPLRTVDFAIVTNDAIGVALSALGGGAPDDVACADSNSTSSVCRQAYSFALEPTACSLNGTYTFTFDVACQPSVAGTPACPLGANGTTTLPIAVTLSSEDLCALAAQALRLSGALNSYAEFAPDTFAFNVPQTAFFQSAVEHFELNVTSDDGFPLSASAIAAIHLTNAVNSSVLLYDGSTATNAAWQFALDHDAPVGALVHRHHFSFVPAAVAFGGAVARGAPVASSVVAQVDVTFQNGQRKRALVDLARAIAQSMTTGAAISASFANRVSVQADAELAAPTVTTAAVVMALDTHTDTTTTTNAPTPNVIIPVAAGVASAVALCCCCLLLCVFVVRRRRDREQREHPSQERRILNSF